MFPVKICWEKQPSVGKHALLDSGANACFMDHAFVKKHAIPLESLRKPTPVEVVDGRAISSGAVIQETVPVRVSLGECICEISFNIISSPANPIILGLPWFQVHNPRIDWLTRRITPSVKDVSSLNPSVSLAPETETIKISTITLNAFRRHCRKQPYTIYAVMVTPTSEGAKAPTSPQVPEKYKEFQDVFDKVKASRLLEHRPYDCPIDLQEGAQPPWGPIYGLSPIELQTLREYIDENLANGFIRHSRSPAGAPIFFVKKKDGSLRLVVDYRGLNKITIRNRYSLPLISSLLEQMNGAKYFSKIDLRGAYNLVRIRPGDEWKTAFRTRYGHFEYTVMPFGLTNAPTVFQHMANDVFREFLDQFVVVYLDDILIYSRTKEEHEMHVRKVLEKLREFGLYAKLEKCQFDRDKVEFLGYIISTDGISMDPAKIKTILEWEVPKNVRDVQCFLGFANFYRKFIKAFSQIALPLIRLTKKNRPFMWTERTQAAFEALKAVFTTAPILRHVDPTKPFFLEADASDFALGAVLSQPADDGLLHPVAFHSRKFIASKINYKIHDKELLAIVDAFEEWRHFLEGSPHQVVVYSNHKNLQYFQSACVLNRRQARWALLLAHFDFVIKYRPGSQQGKADALSRRSYLAPQSGELAFDQQKQVLLGPERLQAAPTFVFPAPENQEILDIIRKTTAQDPVAGDILHHLQSSQQSSVSSPLRSDYDRFQVRDGLLFRDQLLYVPEGVARLAVLQNCHDSPVAGHFGIHKTVELVMRSYWWPQLRQDVKNFIDSCDTCGRCKRP